MNEKTKVLIGLGILTVLLCACSGGQEKKTAPVSGASGQAVSGGTGAGGNAVAVEKISSGASVSESVGHEHPEGAAVTSGGKRKKKYRFCNKYCLYYSQEYSKCIIEHRLSDKTERRIEIGYDVIVCYVDDNWVYYLENKTAYHFLSELYRAPVENKRLNIEKAEQILTEQPGIYAENVYCDGRYLVYTAGEFLDTYYKVYDLEERRFIAGQGREFEDAILYGVVGESVFYSTLDGIMRHDLCTGKTTLLSDSYFGSANAEDKQIAMTDMDIFYAGDDIFAEEGMEEETYQRQYIDSDVGDLVEIGQYHLADGSSKRIITHDQMRELMIREGFLDAAREREYDYYPQRLFVTGGRLYIQMHIEWTEKDVLCQNKAVFSYKIRGNGGLRYEKGLTKCLANPIKDRKAFKKQGFYDCEDTEGEGEDVLYLSRGGCLYMAEGKCFMYLYDPRAGRNRVACYNLGSSGFRFLTKKDSDWYLPYYNGVQPGCRNSDIMRELPNNKSVDWPYW